MQEKLRIAVAGAGFGEKYLLGLLANPNVEVVGIFSRRQERAAEIADQYELPFYTRNFSELLQLPRLDAVAVVTPNSTHAELVLAALKMRKHVICDKPLALHSVEANDLRVAAQRAGVRHVTFVPYRFSPASLAMRAAMAEGMVGRVIGVRARWGVDLREEPLRWRFQSKLSGPGVLTDLGAHILDLLMWWGGPIRRVLGRCQTRVTERPAEVGGRLREVDVPDECSSLIEFAATGVGSVSLTWNEKQDQRIEIEGDLGTLLYESPSLLQWLDGKGPFSPTATFTPKAGTPQALSLNTSAFSDPPHALARMFADVVSYLRGASKPDTVATFGDGTLVLRVIDGILASGGPKARWAQIDTEVE